MIALQIEIDGERYVVAGAEEWTTLHADILAMRAEPNSKVRDGYIEIQPRAMERPTSEGHVYHLRWPNRDLKIGDVITITIVETSNVDAPLKRYRSDAQVQEKPYTDEEIREMRYRTYLELREQFEGTADG